MTLLQTPHARGVNVVIFDASGKICIWKSNEISQKTDISVAPVAYLPDFRNGVNRIVEEVGGSIDCLIFTFQKSRINFNAPIFNEFVEPLVKRIHIFDSAQVCVLLDHFLHTPVSPPLPESLNCFVGEHFVVKQTGTLFLRFRGCPRSEAALKGFFHDQIPDRIISSRTDLPAAVKSLYPEAEFTFIDVSWQNAAPILLEFGKCLLGEGINDDFDVPEIPILPNVSDICYLNSFFKLSGYEMTLNVNHLNYVQPTSHAVIGLRFTVDSVFVARRSNPASTHYEKLRHPIRSDLEESLLVPLLAQFLNQVIVKRAVSGSEQFRVVLSPDVPAHTQQALVSASSIIERPVSFVEEPRTLIRGLLSEGQLRSGDKVVVVLVCGTRFHASLTEVYWNNEHCMLAQLVDGKVQHRGYLQSASLSVVYNDCSTEQERNLQVQTALRSLMTETHKNPVKLVVAADDDLALSVPEGSSLISVNLKKANPLMAVGAVVPLPSVKAQFGFFAFAFSFLVILPTIAIFSKIFDILKWKQETK